jgi:hypothetical protein
VELRVEPADVQAMAARWGVSAGELHQTPTPRGLGLSCQTSAAAVDAAHADVAAFATGLAARVYGHANGVVAADASYLAQEAESAATLSALGE